MASILVTTDLSAESKRAFAPARELAVKLGIPMTLVAVLEDLPFEPAGGGMIAAYPDREQIRKDWNVEVAKLADEIGRDICKSAVVLDAVDVPNAIVDYAQSEKAAYICIATHGRSGLRRLLLGSVAELVIRHSHVPVIVYPPVG